MEAVRVDPALVIHAVDALSSMHVWMLQTDVVDEADEKCCVGPFHLVAVTDAARTLGDAH